MKQPVRSPYGNVFERSTIELWLAEQGHICPLTGKHLALDDLREDDGLRKDIMRWRIQYSAASSVSFQEDVSAARSS
jgi:hypothetical protein